MKRTPESKGDKTSPGRSKEGMGWRGSQRRRSEEGWSSEGGSHGHALWLLCKLSSKDRINPVATVAGSC